jgi:molybdate transport system ATP-binding protein
MALFPHLSVRRNLLYGTRNGGRYDGGRDGSAISLEHVSDVLEITPLLDRSVPDLSGGEARRVAVARALLSSPRLLLLDEPMAGLDRGLRSRVLVYLRKVRDEFRVPMLYVTHEADEVRELCDDVIHLDAGRVSMHTDRAAVREAP